LIFPLSRTMDVLKQGGYQTIPLILEVLFVSASLCERSLVTCSAAISGTRLAADVSFCLSTVSNQTIPSSLCTLQKRILLSLNPYAALFLQFGNSQTPMTAAEDNKALLIGWIVFFNFFGRFYFIFLWFWSFIFCGFCFCMFYPPNPSMGDPRRVIRRP
jgi:hypothetical protein